MALASSDKFLQIDEVGVFEEPIDIRPARTVEDAIDHWRLNLISNVKSH